MGRETDEQEEIIIPVKGKIRNMRRKTMERTRNKREIKKITEKEGGREGI